MEQRLPDRVDKNPLINLKKAKIFMLAILFMELFPIAFASPPCDLSSLVDTNTRLTSKSDVLIKREKILPLRTAYYENKVDSNGDKNLNEDLILMPWNFFFFFFFFFFILLAKHKAW